MWHRRKRVAEHQNSAVKTRDKSPRAYLSLVKKKPRLLFSTTAIVIAGIFFSLAASFAPINTADTQAQSYSTKASCEAAGLTWVASPPIPLRPYCESQQSASCEGLNAFSVACNPAAGNTVMNLSDQAKSWALLNAVTRCIRDGRNFDTQFEWSWSTNQDDWLAGNWWRDKQIMLAGPHEVSGSYLADGTNKESGLISCNNALKQGAVLWGFGSNYQAILCSFLSNRSEGGASCTGTSSDNFDRAYVTDRWQDFNKAIVKKVYGDKTPVIKKEHEYLFAREAFFIGCEARASTVNTVADRKYENVKTVNDDGTTTTKSYEGISRGSVRKVFTQDNLGNYGFWEKNCAEIAEILSGNADAYAQYRLDNPNEPPSGNTTTCQLPGVVDCAPGEGESSCGIDGIGWIICPVMGFLAGISDTAFGFLSDAFLATDIKFLNTDSDSPTYAAWNVMRSFANVAFVIAFLFIIFSQLTSVGVSNYGVKKLLPRLVIAAILVNISFFICQIAVDLSNILGYSLKQLFDGIGTQIQPNSPMSGDATGNGFGIAAIVAGVLVGGVTLIFAATGPVILAAVLALLMIVLILMARTALIVLLIVVSPLAFVAFLLPNTEDWFKKWYKLLFALLLLFPIIAVVFGASSLAAKVLFDAANGDAMQQVIAVGVAAVPLFIVPSLLKGALGATGQLGAKLSGLANKAGGRVGKKYGETSRLAAFNNARRRNAQIKRAQITGGSYRGRDPLGRLSSAASGAFNASGISGAAGTKLAQQSAALAGKLETEDIEAANAQIKQANISNVDLQKLADGGSVKGINGRDGAARAAAMMEQTRRGDFGGLQQSWNNMVSDSSNGSGDVRRRVAQAFSSFSDRPAFIGQGVLGQVARSENTIDATTGAVTKFSDNTLENLAANNGSKYSAQKIAATSNDELQYVIEQQINAGGIQGSLRTAANEALSNPDINGAISNNRVSIEDIATNPRSRP